MFPHNGTDGQSPSPIDGWDTWLKPDQAAPAEVGEPAAGDAVWSPAAATPAAEPGPDDSQWSTWLQDAAAVEPAVPDLTPPAAARSRKPILFVVLGGVAAVVALGAGAAVLMSSTSHTSAPALPVPPSTVPAATTSAAVTMTAAPDPVLGGGPGCDPVRTPNLVRGNGTGAKTSPADVVLAFQHAYYVTRSGAVARSFTTPDALVPTAEVIDGGIATIPQGTRYCVSVSPGPDGQWSVVVTEIRPDTGVQSYPQLVTTTVVGGQTLITRIGAAQ
ncbi:hypothetical protein ACWELJ_21375 [Nocardia sp. NPDC004582]